MSRNYCFTLNNYSEEEYQFMLSMGTYCIIGREVGESGTSHLQGYIEFKSPTRFDTLKNRSPRAHWEARKGSQEQAVNYCKKDGMFEERGEMKNQGSRGDLDAVRQNAASEGMRHITRYCNVQQIRVAEKFLTYNEEPREWKPEVTWIHGPTGTGKSRKARELLEDPYTKNDGTKWWEGYDAHEDVIIDDFRDSWWSLTEMLSLLDRYEKRVEYKGGSRQFKARRIVITCCRHPGLCYTGTGEDIAQLLRRIDKIVLATDATEVEG
nr:MAG: replication associated protein [ssDNA virus sp.]